jgi:hypothetical protein
MMTVGDLKRTLEAYDDKDGLVVFYEEKALHVGGLMGGDYTVNPRPFPDNEMLHVAISSGPCLVIIARGNE